MTHRNIGLFLMPPFKNSDRRQDGGDEANNDVFYHNLRFLHLISKVVMDDISDFGEDFELGFVVAVA
ncbi:MAG: hypothetical protein K2N48_12990 [Muribaculaceae bacterium]|nr:hypothetical protein [Muribaculaceae bacterium]